MLPLLHAPQPMPAWESLSVGVGPTHVQKDRGRNENNFRDSIDSGRIFYALLCYYNGSGFISWSFNQKISLYIVWHKKEAPGKILITYTIIILLIKTNAIYAKTSIVKINNFI